MKKKLIIYIAGYGRSGSTILEFYISKYISVLSLGEISMLNKEYYSDKNLKCICGKKYNLCKLNKNLIYKDKKKNLIVWYKKILPQTSILIKYFFYFYLKNIKKVKNIKLNDLNYIKNELELIDKVFPNAILVESSKSTLFTSNKPYILRKLGYEVIIIHVYRSFFSTLKSVLKGSNAFLSGKIKKEKPFRVIRFLLAYFLANLKATTLSISFPYLLIKNNEIYSKKKFILKKIKKFIFNEISIKKINFKKTNESHMVGGNRLKEKLNK